MRTILSVLLLSTALTGPVLAAPSATDVLSANKAASGGAVWDTKAALQAEEAYSGQGMTGKITSLDDLKNGRWTDSFAIGPATGANGFDGAHAWDKDPSGSITTQDGGEQRELAVNEAYRRANMWWRADLGGASIVSAGEKTEGGTHYDVLTVTPKDGKKFDAWFDARTHLLARTVEQQGSKTFTTTLSDYRDVEGAKIAFKFVTNQGDPKYDQSATITNAAFAPEQSQEAYSAPKVTLSDFSIAGGSETSFPFHLYNNHIYADVRVNGKGPYQFIFDTGGVNLLTPPLAGELGLKTEGQMEGTGAGNGHMDVGLTKVTSLQLGNATVKDQVFAVTALQSMKPVEGVGMPGMVGFETFRRFVTRVDYGTGTMTLMRPEAFDPKDAGVPIHFTFNGNTIEAPAVYNGVPGTFTIDTGSRASLTLNGPFVAKNGFNKSGKGVDAITGWGVGGPSRAVAMRGDTLSIGPMLIHGPVVELSTDKGGAFSEASLSGNIGAGILKRYIVTLDYEHSTMYLKPVSTPIADLDTFDRAGFWFNESGDGYKIIDTTKHSPAEAAGLKAGDEITAVNGQPAKGIPLYELRRQLRNDAPGTVVTFTVKRGGASKDVKLTLRDLI